MIEERSVARELRRAFDQTFAGAARAGGGEDSVSLLALRVAGDTFAVRIGEVAGLVPRQRIVPLPGPVPELLGIAGLRGGLVPVYGLGALLGYRAGGDPPPWTILVGPELIGLAFEAFEGYLRVARSEIATSGDPEARPHVSESARIAGRPCGIIDLRSVRGAVEEKARLARSPASRQGA